MKTAPNPNAERKIDLAIRRGWTRDLLAGPCRYLRMSKIERIEHRRVCVARANNRWRAVNLTKPTE
jgi:hypothetical protein